MLGTMSNVTGRSHSTEWGCFDGWVFRAALAGAGGGESYLGGGRVGFCWSGWQGMLSV
ncbi:hypothetical protein Thimo_2440 [Thioflavicoccus mobilis 8321]|uniref:Uncharacterized protein n=1 Tax=Thioflavicoccus mobilis 8321 TaxID=765912 RepID=L0GWN7_9GAMM|nr:hypothetical protein Thimo_2440 [Thioflavicoccus mobilis 8321]